MYKVLTVDDNNLIRGTISNILKYHKFIALDASNGIDALAIFKNERPDAVILDLKMKGMDGIRAMQEMKKINQDVPIIILTAYGDVHTAVDAAKAGAYDFFQKPPDFDRLLHMLQKAIDNTKSNIAERNAYAMLTPREKEVFHLTAEGRSSIEVAELLQISPRTVETHRSNLMDKLCLKNRTELVRYAIQKGIIPKE